MKSSYIKWGLGVIAAGMAVMLLDAWFLAQTIIFNRSPELSNKK